MMIAFDNLLGNSIAHCKACIPPRLPPATLSHFSILSSSLKRFWLLTQSETVTIGKLAPNFLPV